MHWHIEGKEMALKDVPAMAILKEWRVMATGPRGEPPTAPLTRQNSQPANEGASREPPGV